MELIIKDLGDGFALEVREEGGAKNYPCKDVKELLFFINQEFFNWVKSPKKVTKEKE